MRRNTTGFLWAHSLDSAISTCLAWSAMAGHRHRLRYLGDGAWRVTCLVEESA